MNAGDYNQKASEILRDERTYELLNLNPLKTTNYSVRSKTRQLSTQCPDNEFLKKFLTINSSLVNFHGLPKIHKPSCRLRPFIANIGTVTRPSAGWLAQHLCPYLGTFWETHLSNTQQFKEKTLQFSSLNSLNSVKMLSLDIVSLFTNMPVSDVLDFIDGKITAGSIRVDLPRDIFMSLLRLYIKGNVFEFNGKCYRQGFGISMGSPLSPVPAGLYIEFFETELLRRSSISPASWLRYVDDVFVLWRDDEDFTSFFSKLTA